MCTVSKARWGDRAGRGVRQMPQFRGWPAADRAVLVKSADIDSPVLAVAGFQRERDQVDIGSLLSTGS